MTTELPVSEQAPVKESGILVEDSGVTEVSATERIDAHLANDNVAENAAVVSEDEAFWKSIPEAPTDKEVKLLRSLLFSREIAIIEKLRSSYTNAQYNAKKVGNILAEAILLRSKSDNGLNVALESVVDNILQSSLQKRKTEFVDVLYPLMGPTIRKSIAESFRSMMADFGKSMEMAFSWKGLRWRLEALRTGKTFSEVVLLHTLEYRVEQVFFIHSDTGLLLSYLINEEINAKGEGGDTNDAGMLSGMLTAIQDFVRDCFKGGDVESMQMGECTIYIKKSRLAYLACVVRGIPPVGLQRKLEEILEMLLIEYADELNDFCGDTAPFADAARLLETCMLSHYQREGRQVHPFWGKWVPYALALSFCIGLGVVYYGHAANIGAHREAIAVLRAEPGLMIVHVQEESGIFDRSPWKVIAFHDEFARMPADILTANGMDAALFSFNLVPFISHDRSVVLRRAEKSFSLPETVSMSLDNGLLTFKGTAPMAWILHTREAAMLLPGVKQVDMRGLRDPLAEEIARRVKIVEGVTVRFPAGGDMPITSDQPHLNNAMDALVELERLTRKMGIVVSLTIYGHADATGTAKRNYEISQARAHTVASMLYARGSGMPISIYGMGSQYPSDEKTGEYEQEKTMRQAPYGDDLASRRIEFRVHLTSQPTITTERLLSQ
ncbi:MAG: OmpA family protein [Candidatus Accumulibacter sp.]|jgi:OOP family OmpA-OmpF porin|nr:OmpA family protein [Accumulibacter sp.]